MKNKLFLFILISFALLAYGQRFVKVANNLSELALLNPNDVHTNAFVAGGTVSGDGGGGVFTYNRSSTTTTNTTDVIKPVSYAGRWLRAIPSMNYTNGSGNTYLTINTNIAYVTNVMMYFTNSYTTNITSYSTNVQNYATNLYVTNLTYNTAIRGTEQISGTNAVINWTNQFLKRWELTGNSFPVFSNVPAGTNEAQVQVDIIQPMGGGYTITWPDVINWRSSSAATNLTDNTTNTFVFQWNGEYLSGWLVDGSSGSGNISGTLTPGYLPYATGANSLGDSLIHQSGANNVYADLDASGPGNFFLKWNGAGTHNFSFTGDWLQFSSNSVVGLNLYPAAASGTTPFTLNSWITQSSGNQLELKNNGTNIATVAAVSGYTGAGTKYLSDDGTYKAASGAGTTINSTDGYLPYRVNGTSFGDSPWYRISTNSLGFNTTNMFMWVDDTLNNQGEGLHTLNIGSVAGSYNTSYGPATLYTITSGSFNSAFGFDGLTSQLTGDGSTAVGAGALHDTDASYNTGIGYRAGYTNTTGVGSVFIGYNANPLTGNLSNVIIIGAGAQATNSNEIVIGTSTNTKAIFPITSYSGAGTKYLSDDGSYKTVSSGGISGTVINTGTPVSGSVPKYTDTTGTNIGPSKVTLTSPATGSTLTILDGKTLTANNSITLAGTDSTTMTFPTTSQTIPGLAQVNTWTQNGAVSASPNVFNGTWYSGGSATTTKPYMLVEPTGTTSTGWATSGTGIGGNAASGFTGNLLDLQLAGARKVVMTYEGRIGLVGTTPTTSPSMYITSPIWCASSSATIGNSVGSGLPVSWAASSDPNANNQDLFLFRDTTATLQLGADAATATAQTIKAHDGSGTDKAGASLTIEGGQSTGTGVGGAVIIKTSLTSTTGSSANSYSTRSYQSAKFVDLTEASATLFANIALASSKFLGATVDCTVTANDGTDFQALHSILNISAVNKAGTVTVQLTQVDGTVATSSGTLTPVTYTAVANGNGVDLKCAATSSLSQTVLRVKWMITALNTDDVGTVTAQ